VDALVAADSYNYLKKMVDDHQDVFHHFLKKDVAIFNYVIGRNKPFALILPGGAYSDVCSMVEGFAIAEELNKLGYNAFIGIYSVGMAARFRGPLDDVNEILTYIINHAEKWQIDVSNYMMIGFSAGAHLAASFCTKYWGYDYYHSPKPQKLILGYPVIDAGSYAHEPSIKRLLIKGEPLKNYSIQNLIDKNYPMTYLFQAEHDKIVSPMNTKIMADALEKIGVPVKVKLYPGNSHGFASRKLLTNDSWLYDALDFFEGFEK